MYYDASAKCYWKLAYGTCAYIYPPRYLIRYNKKLGKNVLWQPGTDHAGIATEIVVEKQLEKREKIKNNFSRREFIEKIWDWKKQSGNKITNQMNRLGTSVDWSISKFTMDDDLLKLLPMFH